MSTYGILSFSSIDQKHPENDVTYGYVVIGDANYTCTYC